MSRRKRVLIEFTEDTEVRSEGDRLLVDPISAKSFVETKKVAKLVVDEVASDEQPEAAAVSEAEAPPKKTAPKKAASAADTDQGDADASAGGAS